MRGLQTTQILSGIGIGDRMAMGKLHWLTVPAVREAPRAAAAPAEEEVRFLNAARQAQTELEALYAEAQANVGEEAAQIFSVHAMIVADEDFSDEVLARIRGGESAEQAVLAAADSFADRFAAMDDAYLRARAADFRDIAARLCDRLAGREDAEHDLMTDQDAGGSSEPVILVAEDLTPSQTVKLDKSRIAGFVTGAGSSGSHTAILAKTMGIPALVGVGNSLSDSAPEGCTVILDAATGTLTINPGDDALAAFAAWEDGEKQAAARLRGLVGLPAETRSGRRVRLYANIGSPEEASLAAECDAEGVGLMRSEFLYLGLEAPPDEETQTRAYRRAAEQLGEKPLIIRTLDIGADKRVDYLGLSPEENPALGLRAIRLCLTNRPLFRTQLRAICRAAGERPGQISVMFPMICRVSEVEEALRELYAVREELAREGIMVDERMQTGIMIETPAAAWLADELGKLVDFFSIGTNDLIQYTLAVDRQNPAVAPLADGGHPAVLGLISRAADAIHAHGGWCGICGELAADLSMTEVFLRMGIDELSVSPPNLLALREKIRSCD